MTKKKITFQQGLTRLETIIAKIEASDISLEDSVALYKEGIELSLFCSDSLQAAEKEVVILQKNADNHFTQKPFTAIPLEGFDESKS